MFCCVVTLLACDKHDPVLPGVRTAIFDTGRIEVKDKTISDVPEVAAMIDNSGCPYTQDSRNVIWDGTRKIFSGFATSNTVAHDMQPVCAGKYVYAGLTTGEVVKINPKNRQILWIADVYRPSNLTGGASMVDIIVPPFPYGVSVYAGSLGGAFCRLSAATGAQDWCVGISVAVPFIIAGNYAFVVATDKNLYAINTSNGEVYWRVAVADQVAPSYEFGVVKVGREKIDISTGKII